MKKAGKSNKVIMDTLGIKNANQVSYSGVGIRMNCTVFHQPILGKQYTYKLKGMKHYLSRTVAFAGRITKKVSELGRISTK